MGFFDFLKTPDINAGVADFRDTENAVLFDVRTKEEYDEGHVPDSINLPVDEIVKAEKLVEKNRTVFTYCQSGARSSRAAQALKQMGFTDVRNIGGIMNYNGRTER